MRRDALLPGAFVSVAIATLAVAALAAAATDGVQRLASMPGKSPEGIGYGADGHVYFSSAGTKELLRYKDGRVETFATLPIHALVVVASGNGFVVDGHVSVDMTDRSSLFSRLGGAGRLVAVDRNGKVTREVQVGSLPNGLVRLRDEVYLAADSVEGRIWQVDMASGTVAVWFESPLLLASTPGRGPGVNGMKRRNDTLYLAHSSRGAIFTLGIGTDGKPRGELMKLGDAASADDFDVASDGTVYVATHGPIVRIGADGTASAFTDANQVAGGPALMLSRDQKSLLVLTSGPALPAAQGAPVGAQPPRGAPELLRIPLP